MRHAERASSDKDSELSAAGEKRAQCLAQTLRDAHIKSIFTTEFKRTRQAAARLAEEAGVKTHTINSAKTKEIADAARRAANHGAVLIVGHSNTVPEIARMLGAEVAEKNMMDDDYDRLLIVHLSTSDAIVTTLHFCPTTK